MDVNLITITMICKQRVIINENVMLIAELRTTQRMRKPKI